LGLLGVPAHLTSLSATRADRTPDAVRAALHRFGTHFTGPDGPNDLSRAVRVSDLGNIAEPDSPAGQRATCDAVAEWLGQAGTQTRLLLALGGDNSITVPVALGARAGGLVTLDAHHDLRDGASNGSPVRQLVESGLRGDRVVQIGISDFANSPAYAQRARDLGISVIRRDELEVSDIGRLVTAAIDQAGAGGAVHVDLDVDVCDRSVAPACPASVPGGISAHQLRRAARAAAAHPKVLSMDITEVDASADTPDQRTVRLAALCVLEIAAGLAARPAAPDGPT
jgi:formiminoglutamase